VPGDYFSGSVGSPCLSGKVKLVDVPEKEYFAKDGKGEVCVKGTSVFVGKDVIILGNAEEVLTVTENCPIGRVSKLGSMNFSKAKNEMENRDVTFA